MSKAADKLAHLSPEQKKLLAQKLKAKKQIHLFPLSYAQQRMWFLERLNPGSPVYNLPFAIRIKGDLKPDIFEAAIKKIIRRHEILRTTFREVKGEVRQVVSTKASIGIERLEAGAGEIESLVRQKAQTSFDLEKGPLGLISLITLAPGEYVMVMVMHHIISDGWSMGVLIREFSVIYDALRQEKESPLPPLKIQYADFAAWQKKWLEGERLQQQLTYWRKTLTSSPPVLELPGDKPRPRQLSNRGAQIYRHLDNAIWKKLKDQASAEQLTDFMLLLGAFYLLLHRYTRQEDICIGTPVANRNRAETESLIGFFVNTLVLRCAFDENDSPETFFKRVRETALSAFAHQDIPFEMLVQELQPARDMSHSPLFQAFFTHTPRSALPARPGPFSIEPLDIEITSAKFELSLFTQETDNGLTITFEYNSDLYSDTFCGRLADHFVGLLSRLSEKRPAGISDIELITATEKERILKVWNDTATAYPAARPLLSLFEDQVKKTPDHIALRFGDEDISYAGLDRAAGELAARLQERGVGPEHFVGLYLERSPRLVIAMYAILKAGAAYVPLDPDYPEERIRYMIEDAGAGVIISEKALRGHPALSGQAVLLCDDIPESAPLRPVERDVDQAAYMIYTSGSTGRPKGVVISHRAIWNRLQWMQEKYGLTAEDRVLQKTPYSFDVSVWEFFWPLQCGATLVIAKPGGHKDPAYLRQLMATEKITTIHFVPSMLQAFLNSADISSCTALKRVICSGEALSRELVQQFYRASTAELHNLYGPTEAAVDVTQWLCHADDQHGSTPIGQAIANTQIYIVDSQQHLLPPGVAGELLIGGVQLARSYHRRPELTAEKFIPDPFSDRPGSRLYRTGDLARFMENGAVEFLGRIDHQVKLRGLRIELGEIENALKNMEAVADAVVLVKDFGADDQRLVAYVQLADETDEETLRQSLARNLPDYMVPGLFLFLQAIPLSPSGKVDRRALLAMDVTIESEKEYVAPEGETERELAAIFAGLLSVDKVGRNDSFFDLGGHSLLATRLISRIRDVFDIELEVRAIFETHTVQDLARRIETSADSPAAIKLPPLTATGDEHPLVLSFSQQRLWFLDQLEPGSPQYNIPVAIRASGRLNREAFGRALEEIIRRQESFRTGFRTSAGQPEVFVTDAVPLPLSEEDISALPADEQESHIRQAIFREARRSFDLARPPLFHVHIIRMAAGESVLLLNMHHIISDGWSVNILFYEIGQYYAHFDKDEKLSLPALPVQYKDYARWQRQWLRGEPLEQLSAFWRQTLAGAPALLELPADRPRPAVQSYNGAHIYFKLSPQTSAALNDFSRREGLTLFMTTLGLFKILLYKYSGQDDISVGTPVANRPLSELEPLIGFFVNTLVLRSRVDSTSRVRDYLRQVKHIAFDAFAHQNLPFEKVVDVLDAVRDPSYSPLFQVMFALQNQPRRETRSGDLNMAFIEVENKLSKFDLTLNLTESDEQIIGDVEYNTDLFDAATIEALISHYIQLTENFIRQPDSTISDLALLSDKEQDRLLREWNRTTAEFDLDAPLPALFSAQASKTPAAPAIVMGEQTLSFAEVEKRSNRLARYLLDQGLQKEDIVAVYMPRSPEALIALWAIMKAGGVYLPLDPFYPPERISYMLKDSRAAFCLMRAGMALEELAQTRAVDIDDRERFESYTDSCPPLVADTRQLAYVIYTSGSTGRPKGVMISHRAALNLMHNLRATVYAPLGPEKQRISLNAPLPFDASMQQIVMMALGHCLVIIPDEIRADGRQLLEYIRGQRIAVYDCVPSQLKLILEAGLLDGEHFKPRVLLPGGEALDASVWNTLREARDVATFNMYGPTECAVDSTICDLREAGETPVIGKPVANAAFYILDDHMQPVPPGVAGELYISGAGLARGYLKRPGLTAEKFLPDPFTDKAGARMYRTGDLVRYRRDGQVQFIGRADHQVKVRGFRIELGEIESRLKEASGVRDAVVIVREDSPGMQRLVAYLTAGEGARPSVPQLRDTLKAHLPDYMVPAVFIWLESFPLTPNKKIDIKALPLPDNTRPELETKFVAPSTENEKILADIVCGVLKIKQVGIHDNFFELGGDSIMSIQVISRAREQGLFLTPMQMFQNQTIAQLALVAQKGKETDTEEGVLSGELPLTPIQHFFFERNLTHMQHWNQSVLFQLTEKLQSTALHKTVQALIARHDALRLRFRSSGEGRQAFYDDNTAIDAVLEEIALSGDENNEIEGHCRRAQASFDLEKGPIVKVLYFRGEKDDHLAIIVHHLAMDGVSWRILLEDFQQAYALAVLDQEIILSAKTSSYRQWAAALMEFAADKAREDAPYWQAMSRKNLPQIPVDFNGGRNLEKDKADISVSLDAEQSRLLTGEAHKAYNTEINDLLLSALIRAYGKWSGQRRMLLHLEGHGREQIRESLDVSHTIGWFTALYPLLLDLGKAVDTGEQIKAIKEQFHAIPHNGLSFGVLRYLSADKTMRDALKPLDKMQIIFNYLGQFDGGEEEGPFRESGSWQGPDHDPGAERLAAVEINGQISAGILKFTFSYSRELHREETIRSWAEDFIAELRGILEHCKNPQAAVKTASDFKMAGLDNKKLDKVLGQLGKKKKGRRR